MGKRELDALLNLSSWCLVMVKRLFLAVQRGYLRFVIVVFPDHIHLLFLLPMFVRVKYLVFVLSCSTACPFICNNLYSEKRATCFTILLKNN